MKQCGWWVDLKELNRINVAIILFYIWKFLRQKSCFCPLTATVGSLTGFWLLAVDVSRQILDLGFNFCFSVFTTDSFQTWKCSTFAGLHSVHVRTFLSGYFHPNFCSNISCCSTYFCFLSVVPPPPGPGTTHRSSLPGLH